VLVYRGIKEEESNSMFEYMDKAWTLWTGMDIVQVVGTVVVIIVAYALLRAIILAGKAEKPS
jgi:hypothetical protein